jgi:hypothetical protein
MNRTLFNALAKVAEERAVRRINKIFHKNAKWLYYEIWIDFDEINWEKYYPFAEKYPNLCIGMLSNFFVNQEKFYNSPRYTEHLNNLLKNAEFH